MGFPFERFDVSVISVEVQVQNYYELDIIFFNAGYAKLAVLGGDHVYARLRRGLTLPDGADEWHRKLSKDFHAHAEPQTALFSWAEVGGSSCWPGRLRTPPG